LSHRGTIHRDERIRKQIRRRFESAPQPNQKLTTPAPTAGDDQEPGTMKKALLLFAASVSLVFASTVSTKVTLFETALLNGAVLQPGEYKVEVNGDKMTLQRGKTKAESAVTVEQAESKFDRTAIRYKNGDGKYRITEIRIGGTNTKLVVN
jgi:hypothetical protein